MSLFGRKPVIINIGLQGFVKALEDSGVRYVHVDWRPPVSVSEESRRMIECNKGKIENANKEALKRILGGRPLLVGMGKAVETIPGMTKDMMLHAGPPITWENMCGPMKGAVVGALIYERIADTPEKAEALAAAGNVVFAPCHQHNSVGPMAGIISPSMPVFIVRNEEYGNYSYCTMNEGLGKVLRYGAYSPDVIVRLRWMEEVLYPTLKEAIAKIGRIELKLIIATALHMGDEVHNRNRAATSLFYRALAPAIVRVAATPDIAAGVLEFINSNDHFFLNLSMAACKATLDAAKGITGSSIVTAMSRNGVAFGIQLSGTGERWFTGPAPVPDALYFSGFSKNDANPDIGDSSITETGGLGGFAIAASPAIVGFVGGSLRQAITYTTQMYEITAAENSIYQIPYLNFRGTPTGIDVTKVIEKNILPFIDTGVAHREPGIGQIGAGILSAPVEPFMAAYEGLASTLKDN